MVLMGCRVMVLRKKHVKNEKGEEADFNLIPKSESQSREAKPKKCQ